MNFAFLLVPKYVTSRAAIKWGLYKYTDTSERTFQNKV
jgi:hypothetical protein